MSQVHKVKTGIFLTFAVSLAIVLCAPSTVAPAKASKIGSSDILSIDDYSAIPQSVIDDIAATAAGLFGNEEKRLDFISQNLALYLEAQDKDVIVFINSGGWGWSAITKSNEKDLTPGIDSVLTDLGNDTLWIDYYRTPHSFYGGISEFMMAMGTYSSKSGELAARAEFLTKNMPGIKVILLGISNGCTICVDAMKKLENDGQIYSIQMGPPVWNDNSDIKRALVMRSNGTINDAFSYGDMLTIIRANLEAAFGISQTNPGNILLSIGAPGHDYGWEYDGLQSRVTEFLTK
ncbi:MAG: hypothetical protein PHE15_03005, partial [Dehalococcoidales bacterium]|nr:hypothetical protein [Dehalococcoidales bacterium]